MKFFNLLTLRIQITAGFLAFTFPVVSLAPVPALAQTCSAPATEVVSIISLPGAPFSVIPTKDGCTIFVSMNSQQDRAIAGAHSSV